jgi:hypothetical protein
MLLLQEVHIQLQLVPPMAVPAVEVILASVAVTQVLLAWPQPWAVVLVVAATVVLRCLGDLAVVAAVPKVAVVARVEVLLARVILVVLEHLILGERQLAVAVADRLQQELMDLVR